MVIFSKQILSDACQKEPPDWRAQKKERLFIEIVALFPALEEENIFIKDILQIQRYLPKNVFRNPEFVCIVRLYTKRKRFAKIGLIS